MRKQCDNCIINGIMIKRGVIYAYDTIDDKTCLVEFPDPTTTEYIWLYGVPGFNEKGWQSDDIEYKSGGKVLETFREATETEVKIYVDSHPLYNRLKDNLWWGYEYSTRPDFYDKETRSMFNWFITHCKTIEDDDE